jgi:hypothetical protein
LNPNIVESFVEVKPKDNEVYVDLKPNVDYKENIIKHNVSKLVDNEVDAAKYFLKNVKYKVRDDLNNWTPHQASTTRFTLIIDKSDHGVG